MVDSLLQDTTALTKRADELRKASAADIKAGREKIAKSSSGVAKAGLALAASSDKRIKSFGLGMAASGAIKNASKREKALAELTASAEEDASKIKAFKAQVEKNEQTKKNLSEVAPSVVEGIALFKQQGRAGNAQDQAGLDKTITDAIIASDPEGFAGMSATWNDAANQALITKADGTEGVIGLNEMFDLIQNEEQKTVLSNQVFGTSTMLAGQEAEAKVAKAQAISDLAGDADKDTRIGLGLDSLTQKTQEITNDPFAGVVSPIGSLPDNQLPTAQQEVAVKTSIAKQNEVRAAATAARDTMPKIEAFRDALDNFSTGADKPSRVVLGQLIATVNPDLGDRVAGGSVSDAEALKSLGTEFMLSFVNQTKGSISESENKLFLGASPGLSKTEAGNRQIVKGMEARAKRSLAMNDFYDEYYSKYGTMRGADSIWGDYTRNNPIVTKDFTVLQGNIDNWKDKITLPGGRNNVQQPTQQNQPINKVVSWDAF